MRLRRRAEPVIAEPRLTIDATVVRDYLDPDEPRHALAARLFEIHHEGRVKLALATSGYNLDIFFNEGPLRERVRELIAKEGLEETTQLAYPGLLVPGANAIPGAGFPALHESWDDVAATWGGPGRLPRAADRAHVESHLMERRDVFVTDDEGLLTMCRRLAEEHGVAIDAVDVGGVIARFDRPLEIR
jgi:hypothetical protein